MDQDQESRITTVHTEILQSLILTKLDGPTLAALSCTSSELLSLSTEEQLWQKICSDAWPSIKDPRVGHAVSSFRHGHRSFFSDSYPLLRYNKPDRTFPSSIVTSKLISAVDVYYKGVPMLSKVVETETLSSWFMCSPFRIDLFEPKEMVHTSIKDENTSGESYLCVKHLEENLTLSWILIDPSRNRAMNVSTHRAVSAQRHWLTGEVQVKFSSIMGTGRLHGGERERAECALVVTCGGGGEELVRVREVSMVMEDMEGKSLSGKDSLVILQGAVEGGERKSLFGWKGKESCVRENDGKVRFEEFLERKRIWKENNERKERILDSACIAFGIIIFFAFWLFVVFK